MEGKEIKIGLYCYEEDYTHTIYLYYEGENGTLGKAVFRQSQPEDNF